MKVIQMVSAGCNRECFVLTEDGRVFLLRYSSGDNYKWLEMPSIPSVARQRQCTNEFPKIDYSALIKKYGEKNVEDTCIYIVQATDLRGLAVSIQLTYERVAKILDIVHGEFLN